MQFIVLFCIEKAELLFGHILIAQHMNCCRHRRDKLNAKQQRVLDYLHIESPPFLIRIEQLTGHFVEQGRIVEHFLNLLLRAAVVE